MEEKQGAAFLFRSRQNRVRAKSHKYFAPAQQSLSALKKTGETDSVPAVCCI